MRIDVFNISKEVIGFINVDEKVFAIDFFEHLIIESVNWHRSRWRTWNRANKSKSEVKGSGKKPFPQKGRGKARQGSLKNPHQIGGGVAFAMKPKKKVKKMNKKKRFISLRSAISYKLKNNMLKVINFIKLDEISTKKIDFTLKSFFNSSVLVIDVNNYYLKHSINNLKKCKYLDIRGINVFSLMRFNNVLMTVRAISLFENKFKQYT